jgi:hypothetical protein
MQRGVKTQTQQIDDARNEREPLTDEQKAQIQENARQQNQAKEFAERLAKALSRNRQLAGRVQEAGKHMGEAQRQLDKQQTGDPTQESEDQAIIRLSQALKQAQSQSQSQSQSQQQQQQQRQQQQQQQQQAGQPKPGQQQQGSSPAMRSLQRRANREDGTLGDGTGNGRAFGLDSRSQDALRQGYKEKSPAEFQDLINRYYRALSSKSR